MVETYANDGQGVLTDILFYERNQGYGECYLHKPPNPTIVEPLAGYASAGSVKPGETICFHVASQVGPYKIRVHRQGVQEMPMADVDVTPADPLPIPRMAYRDGAGWPRVASLTIPAEWPSGHQYGTRLRSIQSHAAIWWRVVGQRQEVAAAGAAPRYSLRRAVNGARTTDIMGISNGSFRRRLLLVLMPFECLF
jgi:hypothetical protein